MAAEAHLVVCGQCVGRSLLPLLLSWWAVCFLMLKLTCRNRSLGWLNLRLSVRETPVMSFLPTTYVLLQAPSLRRLDDSLARKKGSCCTVCFQIPYLYIPGDRMVYLLINKEAENRQKYFWNIEACTCISGKSKCLCFPPRMGYKHSCCVSTVLFLSKCFISVSSCCLLCNGFVKSV